MASICLNCGTKFYVKRSILELFSTKRELICKECYLKYPLKITFEDIYLDKYKAKIVSMFKDVKVNDLNIYMEEYTKIFKSLLHFKNYKIIFIDSINLTDEVIEELDAISKIFESNIIILTFTKR